MKIPALVRSRKSSMKRSSQYCGGRPRGNTGCCSFCIFILLCCCNVIGYFRHKSQLCIFYHFKLSLLINHRRKDRNSGINFLLLFQLIEPISPAKLVPCLLLHCIDVICPCKFYEMKLFPNL